MQRGDGTTDERARSCPGHLCIKGHLLQLVEGIGGGRAERSAKGGGEKDGESGGCWRKGDAGHGRQDDEDRELRLGQLQVRAQRATRRRRVADRGRPAGQPDGRTQPECIVTEERQVQRPHPHHRARLSRQPAPPPAVGL